ncbi:MAG TPA: energy transducer TonB [Candidatus Acidoferrales bacterium]|nr:energy transducer TonB [Candidatus Acidoferrales bacterium]
MPLLRKSSNPAKQIFRISVFLFVSLFCVAISSFAQQTQVDALAGQAAQVLQKSHAKRVITLDFSGPGLEVTQLGRDLADQFSDILAKSGGKFAVVDRARVLQELLTAKPPLSTSSDLHSGPIAGKTHADAEVLGHLESDGTRVLLAVEIRRVKNGKTIGKFHEALDESKEMGAQLAEVLSKIDYPDSDAIGYTGPTCHHCPLPQYSDAAFNARAEGLVALSVVIEPDGRADNITIQKHLRPDLDSSAVKAAETWIFKPAIGPDSKPAAVRVLIEVSFSLH